VCGNQLEKEARSEEEPDLSLITDGDGSGIRSIKSMQTCAAEPTKRSHWPQHNEMIN